MNRSLFIVTLLAIITVTFVPAFDAATPHHDDITIPHPAQDDGCGCVCHVPVNALLAVMTMEDYLIVICVDYPHAPSHPDPHCNSIDRPPELLS